MRAITCAKSDGTHLSSITVRELCAGSSKTRIKKHVIIYVKNYSSFFNSMMMRDQLKSNQKEAVTKSVRLPVRRVTAPFLIESRSVSNVCAQLITRGIFRALSTRLTNLFQFGRSSLFWLLLVSEMAASVYQCFLLFLLLFGSVLTQDNVSLKFSSVCFLQCQFTFKLRVFLNWA